MAYIGYLLIEHTHVNPVLCVFFNLLIDHVKIKRRNDPTYFNDSMSMLVIGKYTPVLFTHFCE